MERSDLFEAICALLSKTAFPVNNPLGPVNLHSFEGLLSILNTLAKGYPPPLPPPLPTAKTDIMQHWL